MDRARNRFAKCAGAVAIVAGAMTLAACGHTSGGGNARHSSPARVPNDDAELRRLSRENAAEPFWPYRLAEVFVAQGQPDSAEAHLRDSLTRDPAYEPALALHSKLLYEAGRHDEAVQLLEAARERKSGTLPVELCAALALNYQALGKKDEAESVVQSVEDQSVDWKRNGPALVYLRLKGERFLDSPAIAKKSLEADPSNAVNLNNYGIAQLYSGDPEGAKESFLKAHELNPRLPGALYNLAIVEHFYFFELKTAREWYRQYRALSPEDPDGLDSVFASGDPEDPESAP
jgi:tetratricopeptide (TPR) repeat protein